MDKSIEEQFREVVAAHKAEIEAKVDEASKSLSEAVKLSEKYGIPFRASVSPVSQKYTPESFAGKFPDIDTDEIVWDDAPGEYEGWQHSAVLNKPQMDQAKAVLACLNQFITLARSGRAGSGWSTEVVDLDHAAE